MAGVVEMLISWLQILIPQPCFDEYFVKFNFFHVECLKVVVSKGLGFGIILGSVLVKVPQILKIHNAQSGEGISLISNFLEMAAITFNCAYGYSKSFPFSAYGEAIFLFIQTILIGVLVLHYARRSAMAVVYLTMWLCVATYLMSPVVSPTVLWYLQSSVIFNIIIARMLQAFSNFSNGSTGQLSVVTFMLLFLGSIARVFTSMQETGDSVTIMQFIVSSLCNGVVLAQIFYYGDATKKEQLKAKKKR